MRKLIGLFLAAALTISSVMGVAAQDAPSSFVNGFDTPATWTDDRGNEVATVEVNDINPDWTEHSEFSTPDRGYLFQAVTFTVTNISGSSLIVEPFDFSLVDETGRNNARSYVSLDEENEGLIFQDDLPLAADESAELTLVFQTPVDVAATALVWQPESGVLIIVNFGEVTVENAAVVSGMNTPSTWTDDRGNPVATFEVVEIEDDWQDFSEYREPDRGMVYRAVHLTVTNVSGSSLIVNPSDFSMLDSTGMNNRAAFVDAAEGSDANILRDDVPLADGESVEGIVVYQMYPDVEPTAMLWQPERGLLNMVLLDGDGEGAPVASPAASPEVDDADADSDLDLDIDEDDIQIPEEDEDSTPAA